MYAPVRAAMFTGFVLACGDGLFTLPIEHQASVVVERGSVLESLIGDLGFGDFVAMDLTADQELANQGVEPGDITEVRLVSFTLSAAGPAGADLSFLDDVELFVEAPELPRVRVAAAADFPAGTSTMPFDLDDVDLAAYVMSQSLTLSTEVTGRRPDQDTELVAAFVLDVRVTQQGACNALRDSE